MSLPIVGQSAANCPELSPIVIDTPIIRWCDDIGMFAIDRARVSCLYRTPACRDCYNCKLYRMYRNMVLEETALELAWDRTSGESVLTILERKRKQTDRARLMTRGEALSAPPDILKVKDICLGNPETVWWLPTRAWRLVEGLPYIRPEIERVLFPLTNLRLHASIDRYNSSGEIGSLLDGGWSTMWFDKDNRPPPFLGCEPVIRCKKTWRHIKGACTTCRGACFSRAQHHIWLKYHG